MKYDVSATYYDYDLEHTVCEILAENVTAEEAEKIIEEAKTYIREEEGESVEILAHA